MLDQGAVDEVRRLLARSDLPAAAPIRRAIGVPEIAAWLAGERDRSAAIADGKAATKRYAKRQFTWFRNQPPPAWPRTSVTEIDRSEEHTSELQTLMSIASAVLCLNKK